MASILRNEDKKKNRYTDTGTGVKEEKKEDKAPASSSSSNARKTKTEEKKNKLLLTLPTYNSNLPKLTDLVKPQNTQTSLPSLSDVGVTNTAAPADVRVAASTGVNLPVRTSSAGKTLPIKTVSDYAAQSRQNALALDAAKKAALNAGTRATRQFMNDAGTIGYDTPEIRARRNELQSAYNKLQSDELAEAAMTGGDFSTYSKYDANKGNDKDYDFVYEQINNSRRFQNWNRDNIAQYSGYVPNGNGGSYGEFNPDYNHLTINEQTIYNYYYNKGEKDKAQKYLEGLMPELQQRRYEADMETNQDFGYYHPFQASARDILMTPAQGLGTIPWAIESYVNGKTNPYSRYNRLLEMQEGYKTGVKEKIADDVYYGTKNKTLANAASFVYDVGMSSFESMMRAGAESAVPGLGGAGLVSMAMGVTQQATNEYLKQGYTEEEAYTLGIINGLAEYVTEKMGMDRLTGAIKNGGKKTFTGFLKTLIKEGMPEAGEELISGLADNLAELLVNIDKSSWSRRAKELQENGATQKAAEAQAAIEKWKEIGLDTFAGFLSGMISGGGAYAMSAAYNGLTNASVNAAAKSQESTKANRLMKAQNKIEESMQKKAQVEAEVKAAQGQTAEQWEQSRRDQSEGAKKRRAVIRDTGTKYNVAEDTIRSLEAVSDVTGADITILDAQGMKDRFNVKAEENQIIPGFHVTKTGEIVINSETDTDTAIKEVLGHELAHSLEGNKLWNDLRDAAWEYYSALADDETKSQEERDMAARFKGERTADFDLDSELTADFAGNVLLDSTSDIEKLVNSRHGLAQQIWNKLNEWLTRNTDDLDLRTKALLTSAREKYGRALQQNAAAAASANTIAPTTNTTVSTTNTTAPTTQAAAPARGTLPTAAENMAAKEMTPYQQAVAELDRRMQAGEFEDDPDEYVEERDRLREEYGISPEDDIHEDRQRLGLEDENGEIKYKVTAGENNNPTVNVGGVEVNSDLLTTDTIKTQLNNHRSELMAHDPVIEYKYNYVSRDQAVDDALKKIADRDFKAYREGFGEVDIGAKWIYGATSYLKTKTEYATLQAIPDVIEKGTLIGVDRNHKNRGYSTFTFGGPVTLNDKTGLMGVVVKKTSKNRYSTHRIITPEGTEFSVYENEKESEKGHDGGLNASAQVAPPTISDSSNNTIPQTPPEINNEDNNNSKQSVTADNREAEPAAVSSDGETLTEELPGGTMVKYSVKSWNNTDKVAVKKNLVDAGYSETEADRYIENVNSIAAIIAADPDRLDYDAATNQVYLKPNQDYVVTLDASTLCAKRLIYQGTLNKIMHKLGNRVLMPEDLIELSNMMAENNYQTPCGICYVESRRRHLSRFASEWLNNYKGSYKPTLDQLTTTDGLEELRKNHNDVYTAFIKAMNAKGSANPKVVQLRTDYRGDLNRLTPAQIKKILNIGGLRIQSFSDFETPHLIDTMQAVLDMSAKKLTAQAYTKVPNFAWVFGDTGIKINLSLIGDIDENGNLTFSSVEGMDFDEAMKLRNRYSKNVGTILVGKNDAHIIAAMGDDRIDFIIPFHKSGWSQKEIELMKALLGFEDYTEYQSERRVVGRYNNGKYKTESIEDQYYPADYWDYNLSGKENAEKYLQMCAEDGRLPKFWNFLVDNGDGSFSLPQGNDKRSAAIRKGYWKTLIDFKMYDNDGNGAPQRAVTPNINMEEAKRVLADYEGGANELPSASDEFIDKYVEHYNSTHESDVQFKVTAAENDEYMRAAEAGDMETARRMVEMAAERAGFNNAIPEQATAYATRTTAPPKKTIKVYKVFTLADDGSPTALFVSGIDKLPQNVWLNAQDTWHFTASNGRQYVPSTQNPYTAGGKTGGQVNIPNDEIRQELIKRGFLPKGSKAKAITALAYRPGWHAGDLPFFPQGGMKIEGSNYENVHRYNQAVFECEFDADTDYTNYTYNKKGEVVFHDRQSMPSNGYYKFATNPMANAQDIGSWFISGSLKINRALTEEECNRILEENGRPTQEWQQYQDKEELLALKKAGGEDAVNEYEHTVGEFDLSKLGYLGEQYDAARKTLAPITYDDDGNIIPLNERFNPEKNDIRYSIKAGPLDNASGSEYNTLEADSRVLWGNEGQTRTSDLSPVSFRYAVVPADSLIISNDEYGNVNPDYPAELQPRDRARITSQADIQKMANGIIPDVLAESPYVNNGAPIIRGDGVVVGGNGRVAALRLAESTGKSGEYEDYIRQNAARFGIEGELPENPILVRVADTDDWRELARKSNESTNAAMSSTEQALADADALDADILSMLAVDDEGELNTPKNRDFIAAFVNQVAGDSERGSLVDADGYLSQQGLRRVQAAVFAKAYKDTGMLARMSENLDDDMKNVTKALMGAASRAAVFSENVASGDAYDIDVTNEILAGIEIFEQAKKDGTDIDDIAGQMSLEGQKYGDAARAVAQFINTNKRSGAKIRDLFAHIYDNVIALGSPNQINIDLFGGGTDNGDVTISEIFRSAAQRLLDEAGVDEKGKPRIDLGFKIESIGEQTSLPRNVRESEAESFNGNGDNTVRDVRQPDSGRGRAPAQRGGRVTLPAAAEAPDSGRYIDRQSKDFNDIVRQEAAKLGMVTPPEGQLELDDEKERRRAIDNAAQTTREWADRQVESINAQRLAAQAQTESERQRILDNANVKANAIEKGAIDFADKTINQAQSDASAQLRRAQVGVSQMYKEATSDIDKADEARKQAKAEAQIRRRNGDIIVPSTSDKEGQKRMYKELYDTGRAYDIAKGKANLSDDDWEKVADLMRGTRGMYDLRDADNPTGVWNVFQAMLAFDRASRTKDAYKAQKNRELTETAAELTKGSDKWKDKPSGIRYSREKQDRNLRDIAPKDEAEAIIKEYFDPVIHAARVEKDIKEQYNARVKALNISQKPAKGNKVSEAYAIQFIGEMRQIKSELGKRNDRFVNTLNRKLAAYDAGGNMEGLTNAEREAAKKAQENKEGGRDEFIAYLNKNAPKKYGLTYTQASKAYDAFLKENPNLDIAEIDKKIDAMQKMYAELYEKLNETYMRWGYEPMGEIKGYFPHFITDSDNVIQRIMKNLGIVDTSLKLPTEIAGQTADRKPGVKWFGNKLKRSGNITDYDAIEGYQRYIKGASAVIAYTEQIQKLRALANEIRYKNSSDAVKEKIAKIRRNTTMDDDAKDAEIDRIKREANEGRYNLSNYVQDLTDYTNNLAGKRSDLDRGWEREIGREVLYGGVTGYNRLRAASAVAGNMTSAFTNWIPIAQVTGAAGVKNTAKAFFDTFVNTFSKNPDGLREKSDFLMTREEPSLVTESWLDKGIEILGAGFNFFDRTGAETVWRAHYYSNKELGMSDAAAAQLADHQADNAIAGRYKGAAPTLFNAKNPLVDLGKRFQLESNNFISYIFKDLPMEARRKNKSIVGAFLKMFFFLWLFNQGYEALFGRKPAQEPSELIYDLMGDITGYRPPNVFREAGTLIKEGRLPTAEDFMVGKKNAEGITKDVVADTLDMLPFSSWAELAAHLFGMDDLDIQGGRFEMSDVVPNLIRAGKVQNSDADAWSKAQVWAEEISKPVTGLMLFGNQAQKTAKGIATMIAGGSYKVNDKGERLLQYPAESTAGNWARAFIAGKSALPTAQDWVSKGFNTLNAGDTTLYDLLTGAYDVKPQEALDLIKGMNALKSTDDESKSKLARQMLVDSDISGDAKLAMYRNKIVSRFGGNEIGLANDKEKEVIDNLGPEDGGELVYTLNAIKNAEKTETEGETQQKREILINSDLKGDTKLAIYNNVILSKSADRERDLLNELSETCDPDELLKVVNNIKSAAKTDEESAASQKRRAILDSDLPGEGKLLMYTDFILNESQNKKEIDTLKGLASSCDDGELVKTACGLKESGKNVDDTRVLMHSNLPQNAKQELYLKLSVQEDSRDKKESQIKAIKNSGIDFNGYLKIANKYSELGLDDDSAGTNAIQFSYWLDKQGYTSTQKSEIQNAMKYFYQVPADASKYEKLTATGMSADQAYKMVDQLGALQPEDGASQVKDYQKAKMVASQKNMSEEDKLSALRSVYSTDSNTNYSKAYVAYEYGVPLDTYFDFVEAAMKAKDDPRNDGVKEAAIVEAVLNKTNLTNKQKAAIWQCYSVNWAVKNNPYDSNVGASVRSQYYESDGKTRKEIMPGGLSYGKSTSASSAAASAPPSNGVLPAVQGNNALSQALGARSRG